MGHQLFFKNIHIPHPYIHISLSKLLNNRREHKIQSCGCGFENIMLCLALLMRLVVSNYLIRTFEVCSEKSLRRYMGLR